MFYKRFLLPLTLVCGMAALVLNFPNCSKNSSGPTPPIDTTTTNPSADIAVTKAKLATFLGNDLAGGGKLVYVHAADRCVYYVDFADSVLTVKKVSTITPALSPIISPNGKLVTFESGDHFLTGNVYACSLKANTTPVKINSSGNGFNPYWWVDPVSGKYYVIYCTMAGEYNWPNFPGATMQQEVDPATFQPVGSATILLAKSFIGGLSKNGQYLATSYNTTVLYDLVKDTAYILNDGIQSCNPTITPCTAPDSQNQMMHLSLGQTIDGVVYAIHEVFMIRNSADSLLWYLPTPPGIKEWQKCKWATHKNYCVTVADNTGTECGDIYIVQINIQGGQYNQNGTDISNPLKVTGGSNTYPHFWLQYP